MRLVVISPQSDDPRESATLPALFAAGLERYHVRKPGASAGQLEALLRPLAPEWRRRIVVHQHHEGVAALGLGGRHFPGEVSDRVAGPGEITSRSCHSLRELRAALGKFAAVFFGPVFPSVSKPGYGPLEDDFHEELFALLANRSATERRTAVLALGGITAETARRALAFGVDGVAALGAIWQADDPVRAFAALQSSLRSHAA